MYHARLYCNNARPQFIPSYKGTCAVNRPRSTPVAKKRFLKKNRAVEENQTNTPTTSNVLVATTTINDRESSDLDSSFDTEARSISSITSTHFDSENENSVIANSSNFNSDSEFFSAHEIENDQNENAAKQNGTLLI